MKRCSILLVALLVLVGACETKGTSCGYDPCGNFRLPCKFGSDPHGR
jgi:hypothetical protein